MTLEVLDAHFQLCMYAAYAGSQVITMLRQLGVDRLRNLMVVAQSDTEGWARVQTSSSGRGS